MLNYERIEENLDFAAQIWQVEQAAPQWFKDASDVWTPDYESYLDFWKNCRDVWGLFEEGELVAALYIQYINELDINVHVSVIKRVEPNKIVRFFKSLTRLKRSEGVRDIRGWILSKNRFLLQIVEKADYLPTGLKMDYGASRGRVLRWIEVRGG